MGASKSGPSGASPSASEALATPAYDGGEHWLVEVREANPEDLAGVRGRMTLEALFDDLVRALDLHPLAQLWSHTFDARDGGVAAGGTTALLPLTESHLAAHGFPESGTLCLDLFTCRPRSEPDWEALLARHFPGAIIAVRRAARGRAAHSATQTSVTRDVVDL